MNELTRARENLAARYKAAFDGMEFYGIVPPKTVPPFGYVAPDSPYLTFDDPTLAAGEVLVNLRAVFVVEAGANDVQAARLDELIVKALDVDPDPFVLQDVDEPGRLPVNGQEYLAVAFHLSAPVQLED